MLLVQFGYRKFMNTDEIIAISGAFAAVISGLIRVLWKVGGIDIKVGILWRLFESNATSEAVNKSFMRKNSPLVLTKRATEAFNLAGLTGELQGFYRTEGYKLNDFELHGAIEKYFGTKIMQEIALPYNLHSGAAIAAAVKVARSEEKIDMETL